MSSDDLLDLLEVGVIVHTPDGSIQYASAAACRMLGVPREEMLVRTSQSRQWDIRGADGHALTVGEQPAMRALETGESVRGVVLGVLLPNLTDRSWLRVDAVPVKRVDGAVATRRRLVHGREPGASTGG